MIPKILHYCWFGKKPLSDFTLKCIESWKKYCPDYQIREWNEGNFNIDENLYAKEAYEAKKYAFVSDYARVKILYEYGGIYLDTDVEILQNLDPFLKHNVFSGFETEKQALTAVWGSKKGDKNLKEILQYYDDRRFVLNNGLYDNTTNVTIFTKIFLKKGLILNNKLQTINGFTIYPSDFFCPKDVVTKEINITENTYTIHHFDGSWLSDFEKKVVSKKAFYIKKYGNKIGKIAYYFYFIKENYKKYGFKKTYIIFLHKYKTSLGKI